MNCTSGGNQMLKERQRSRSFGSKNNLESIFSNERTEIKCWTKFLGEHTILGHEKIGTKNKITGEIIMF